MTMYRDHDASSGLLRLTAVHESSHVVACLALGGEVDSVTVIGGKDYDGKMSPRLSQRQMKNLMNIMAAPDEPIMAREIDADLVALGRRQITEFLSGAVGEWVFAPGLSSSTGDRHRRGSSDLRLATAIARGISETEEEAEALLNSSRVQARQILLAHCPAVEAIADALILRGTITGAEIDDIIDGA